MSAPDPSKPPTPKVVTEPVKAPPPAPPASSPPWPSVPPLQAQAEKIPVRIEAIIPGRIVHYFRTPDAKPNAGIIADVLGPDESGHGVLVNLMLVMPNGIPTPVERVALLPVLGKAGQFCVFPARG